jgi:hypothetical protein
MQSIHAFAKIAALTTMLALTACSVEKELKPDAPTDAAQVPNQGGKLISHDANVDNQGRGN